MSDNIAMKNVMATLILFFLLIGISLTIYGLAHFQWPGALPWLNPDALIRYVGFLFVSAVLVLAGSWWSKKNALLAGAVVAIGYAVLAGDLWPLFVAIWFAIASTLLGQAILGALRLSVKNERFLIRFLVGAGVYGTVVGLAAHFPVNYPGVYGIALALPIILGWRVILEQGRCFFAYVNNTSEFSVNKLDVAIAVVALIYFVVALLPELGFDSLAMHLFVPVHLALRHQWGFDVGTYVWAVMPMLGDWIFSIGYILAGESAARLINVGFIFTLGWLVREIVLWSGSSIVGARWAVLIFLSTPLTFTEGSSLLIESIWASFVVAGTLVILHVCYNPSESKYEVPVAGLLLGCALAAKAVTLTILPVLLLLLIWRYKLWYKVAGFPFLMLGLGLISLIGLIPYLTAWQLTANPVFPFFNHIFHSIYYSSNKDPFSSIVFNQGLKWDVIYQVTFQSGKFLEAVPGASGFQWLLLFLPASIWLIIIGQGRAIVLLVIGVMWIALVFYSTSYLRYVFPAWVILTASIGVALDMLSLRSDIVKYMGYVVATVAIGLNLLFLNAGGAYGDFAINSVADTSSRDFYLKDRLPMHSAVELVNQLNTGRAPVAVFSQPLTAGLSGDALYPSWYDVAFQSEIASINVEQDLVDILLKRGVNYIILDSNWNGVNCCSKGAEKQVFIEKISKKIAEYGPLSVRKIKTDYRFKRELLSNPDFITIHGWTLNPGAIYDTNTGVIQASVSSSGAQVVAISPGGLYLNTVTARCVKDPTLGRVQINWLDLKGKFVSTNIKTFECSSTFSEYAMEVTAPPNAANAVVYISGQTEIPLEFRRNSLRQ